jgi:tRNA U34 5-methylaminomethyl-2-thiouridine-forming methyltransferase MnmC
LEKNIEIILTEDGSNTLKSNFFEQTYHSINCSIEESEHVFINAGLKNCNKNQISILEVGFGTGLNTLLSFIYSENFEKIIHYTTIEKFPLDYLVIEKLNYSEILNNYNFEKFHNCEWNKKYMISKKFIFRKILADINNFNFDEKYDLIFFDAFSFDSQPEMWSVDLFKKIYEATNPDGFLVTYSSKGIVKQNLRKVGFEVIRLKGYKKRHMLKAIKKNID